MSDDPWAAFIPAESAPPSPAAPAANDPWSAFIPSSDAHATQADGAPLGLNNVPTEKSDPVYHGAVPVAQAPDQGAATAFASGVGGVPIVGPAIEGGLQRAAAGLRSLTGGDSYGAELQHVQDMTDLARQQHPAAAVTGDLTGATLALAPATAAAPGAFGLGPGGITAGKLGMGALSGAGLGAADAAVRSGSPGGVVQGFVDGALGGIAAPVLGAAASRVGGALADVAARTIAPAPGVSRPVADIISRTVANDGALGPAGASNIAAAGPYGMLVDASPSLTKTLDAALQRGGPGTGAARDAITARTAATNADLTGTLDRTLGPAQGVASATADIRNGSAAARQAAYDAAYDTPIDYTSDHGRTLEDMISNRVPPGIMARAQNQMRVDGMLPSQQTMASIAPDGSVSYRQMPDVRMVDYITRSLNDVSRMGDGQGALGGNTSEGRAYGALAKDLRSTLRNAVPAYGDALDTAAQPIQERQALDFGASLLHPSTPTDVAAATVADMTAPSWRRPAPGRVPTSPRRWLTPGARPPTPISTTARP